MAINATDTHFDSPLTNITVAHMQSTEGFVADKIFPNVGVEHQSDKYYVYDREAFNRDEMKELAPGAEPEEVEFSLSLDSYFVSIFGNSFNLTDRMLANEDKQLEVRSAGMTLLATKGMLKREKSFMASYFVAGVWGTEYTGVASASPSPTQVTHWDDYANSIPIEDVTRAKTAMQLKSGGFRPNTGLMSRDVFDVLKNHPDFIARISGGATTNTPAKVTLSQMAAWFELDVIHISDGIENTAKEGAAEVNAFLSVKGFAMYYVPAAPGKMIPSAGYNFTWTDLENVSDMGVNILSFTGEDLKRKQVAEQLQIRMGWDMKVTSADLGVYFATVIS